MRMYNTASSYLMHLVPDSCSYSCECSYSQWASPVRPRQGFNVSGEFNLIGYLRGRVAILQKHHARGGAR